MGYSFKVAKGTSAKRHLVTTAQATDGGLFLHSTDIYRTAWHNLADDLGDLAIQVVLVGDDIREHALGVGSVAELQAKTGQPTSTSVEVINHGTAGAASFDYTYTLAGQTGEGHVDLGTRQLPGIYGRSTTFEVQLPAVEEKGAYPVLIDITRVDGFDNEDVSRQGEGLANLFKTLPKHRVVLEEYTGTWCGYCPRGFVGLEEMARLYPDEFIGLSYHNNDPMEVMASGQFPNDVSGFPAAFLDRQTPVDAFAGFSSGKTFGIDQAWSRMCSVTAPAEVDVESVWTEDSILTATALVTFPLERADCPYEVGFVLYSDGLTGTASRWRQSNYYSGETGWPSSMDTFTKGGSYVSGLTYNFVVVARSSKSGIEGSLSAPIEADVTQTSEYAFDLREVKNTGGEPVIQDKNNLRVVALLIDKETGNILNANKAAAGSSSKETSGMESPANSQRRASATAYYDLRGRRIAAPGRGLFIKAETLTDGTVVVRKEVR